MNRAKQQIIVSHHDAGQGTPRSYTTGFLLSLLLTFMAYFIVQLHLNHQNFSHLFVMVAIIVLAIVQLIVQLIYFLHLDRESKPRWNLTILAFALIVVIILVFGSLWIMYNLNNRMTPRQMQNYMNSQDGF
jgi:cytochrome o ubiquinol oxidase operon protein cyoD